MIGATSALNVGAAALPSAWLALSPAYAPGSTASAEARTHRVRREIVVVLVTLMRTSRVTTGGRGGEEDTRVLQTDQPFFCQKTVAARHKVRKTGVITHRSDLSKNC